MVRSKITCLVFHILSFTLRKRKIFAVFGVGVGLGRQDRVSLVDLIVSFPLFVLAVKMVSHLLAASYLIES